MGGKSARRFLVIAGTLYVVLVVPVLWMGSFFDVAQALGEYLYPTRVDGGYLPQGCTQTNETPPLDLMRIVEEQEKLHHLVLQKVTVCRSTDRLLGFERRFAGLPLGDEDHCRPLYGGCCSCQFGRHIIVEAADPAGVGSVLVRANLIQSRRDYLLHKLGNVRSWAWKWCLIVALFLICALLTFLSGRWLVTAIRRASRRSA